jgi:sec-independent protein translocase protein TatA
MLRAFEPWHLVILAGIAAVLFGAKRLPDSARSIGQSLRIFRSEMNAARTVPDEAPAHDPQSPPSLPTAAPVQSPNTPVDERETASRP